MNYVKQVSIPSYDSSLFEACKANAKITSNDEDAILRYKLEDALVEAENELQTAVRNTNFELNCKCFHRHLSLEKKYVSAINSVKYYDDSGVQQTVASTEYSLQDFKEPNVLYFNEDFSFPSTDDREFPLTVNFNAGFASASTIIPTIREAIFLLFNDRYENRQSEIIGERIQVVQFNADARKLLAAERLWL